MGNEFQARDVSTGDIRPTAQTATVTYLKDTVITIRLDTLCAVLN